ncbi:GNAT family N-acetyltransferase [Nonomuraea diastatica]|uniref:GNAT family N-acetyltransferase n=1 Tax=Nonomuraea diastatica TaxID=1848329 RepID=A0A4R4WGA4_9ACTN|nr:GNAT family N-acetyltransferase [Nonomuraea diastatica]TDD17962.1 GNAT family N-acetyltransferase [Nonomuraea diastatica]
MRITEREAGLDDLPVTFVAMDGTGRVLGGVGLSMYDLEERRDRSPWVVGMIVRPEQHGAGVGQLLVRHLC